MLSSPRSSITSVKPVSQTDQVNKHPTRPGRWGKPLPASFKPNWAKGETGNPAGRPPGARVKLTQRFVEDLQRDWVQHGPAVIEALRETNPAAYVGAILALVPKELKIDGGDALKTVVIDMRGVVASQAEPLEEDQGEVIDGELGDD